MHVVPSSIAVPSDVFSMGAFTSGEPQLAGRWVEAHRHAAGDAVLTLPPSGFQGASTLLGTGDATRVEASWSKDDAAALYTAVVGQQDSNGAAIWELKVTPSLLGEAGTLTFSQPDLSGASGWNHAWQLVPDKTTQWTVHALRSARGATGAVQCQAWRVRVDPQEDLDGLECSGSNMSGSF